MRVLVKICGLTDEAALEAACAAGADAIGVVLASSPRQVTLARARELLARVPSGIERVGVFGRATRAELTAALALELDALQAELDSNWPALPAGVFALPVLRDRHGLASGMAGPEASGGARPESLRGALVLDGSAGGGQGRLVDLARARRIAAARAIVLAGGLRPDNVAACIRAVRPFAVDVSTGVERVPGTKDPGLVRAFVRAVHVLEQEDQVATP